MVSFIDESVSVLEVRFRKENACGEWTLTTDTWCEYSILERPSKVWLVADNTRFPYVRHIHRRMGKRGIRSMI
jgi:hypothetical protein